MDPVTVLTIISVGLKLVDQFRDLALRFMGKKAKPPSSTAEQAADTIQVTRNGKVVQQVKSTDIKMDQWDEPRYRALERRVRTNWDLFNELFAQMPELAADEKARIKIRMERIKGELCEDFQEMVRIYERVLGTGLPDHYQLYEVCQVG
jgi:hypothetical protein